MTSNIRKLLKGVKTLAITDKQFGDTGKGKFVDFFAGWADIIARGTGGANAGHTVDIKGKKHIFHLLPSGTIRGNEGKINVLGTGMVLDPKVLCEEIAILEQEKIRTTGIHISHNAKLVLPHHILVDRLREHSGGNIGTTGRGIGPAYEDHYRRIGLVMNDLLNPGDFIEKVHKNIQAHRREVESYGRKLVKIVRGNMETLCALKGRDPMDSDGVRNLILTDYAPQLTSFIYDTDGLMKKWLGKKNILLEAAQGDLLSIDHGTYPFVTSSDCTVEGLAKGVGIPVDAINMTLGVVKAFYMTRVGGGPFPTELGGETGEKWARKNSKESEATSNGHVGVDYLIGDIEELLQGIAIRMAGDEYGATTKRCRRIGWLDLALLKHTTSLTSSSKRNGSNVILTKLDVLNDCEVIKICIGYRYQGPTHVVARKIFTATPELLACTVMDEKILSYCEPVYKEFPGWLSDISKMRSRKELPKKLLNIIHFVSKVAKVNVKIISVGPERDQTIFL